ncbi:AbrB/MazE/SpoVT family DNA-binding domain-containing protein [Candidatus Woesearchaeota archaeon]|nr:AbrB/MazE/SpoVT family DNA-binding domain-containing protein [Candidatus Woesearchaeota archaeon]
MVRINVKVGPKGQIVIPKVFRNEYNISPGDEIVLRENNQNLVIEKKEDPIVEMEKLAKSINYNKKIDMHAIEEEYEERWKKIRHTT